MGRTDIYSPTPVLILKTVELQTLESKPIPTTSSTSSVNSGKQAVGKGSNFFWLLTVYQWMAEQDFMSSKFKCQTQREKKQQFYI